MTPQRVNTCWLYILRTISALYSLLDSLAGVNAEFTRSEISSHLFFHRGRVVAMYILYLLIQITQAGII
ncbi:hypothetical protein BJX99DRAFT_238247 [Aspergillus californicus]